MSESLEQRLTDHVGEPVASLQRVGGGCIASAWKLTTASGRKTFVKQVDGPSPFAAEALGLRLLRIPGGVRVPEVLFVEDGLLALEYIDFGPPAPDFQTRFGEQLAVTHSFTSDSFGFDLDHFIGATPQRNLPRIPALPGAWAGFWWTHRLEPLLRRLHDSELLQLSRGLDTRCAHLLHGTDEPPSLLHGDLWSGNTAADTQGQPVLFDPAPYFGHREAELAMCGLFGGFNETFYRAYENARPLPEDWRERQPLYRLYHVLNHLLLFGGSYRPEALRLLRRLA